MKTYKLSSILLVVTFAAALFGSCQKDNVTLRVRMGRFESDSKIYMDGLNPIWNNDDRIVINNQAYTVSGTGSSVSLTVPTAAVYSAVYPAVYVVSGTTDQLRIPRVQIYQEDASGRQQLLAPMGAYSQDNTSLLFTPLGSLLAINVTNNANRGTLVLDRVSVRASSAALWGNAEVVGLESASRCFAITDDYRAGINDSVVLARAGNTSLNISIAQGDSKVLYVFIPAIGRTPSNRFTVRVFTHAQGVGGERRSYALSQTNDFSGNIPLAKMASVPFAMSLDNEHIPETPSIEEHLPGLFSVSENLKVYFSRGNLQWFASDASVADAGEWRFAESQYDCLRTYGASARELFGWSTAATTFGMNTSWNFSDYSGDFVDWGTAINPGGAATPWRTLSSAEWQYLLGDNTHRSGKWGLATITNVAYPGTSTLVTGLVLLPDNWTSSQNFVAGYGSRFATNQYSAADWAEMEAAGAVFLPAAGYRNGASVYGVGSKGSYWSSTPINAEDVYYMSFFGGGMSPEAAEGRDFGQSVRLVQNN